MKLRQAVAKAVPAGLMLALVVLRSSAVRTEIDTLTTASSLEEAVRSALLLLHVCLGGLFYLLIAVMFVVRYPALARTGGPRATLLAFAGVFGAAPLAVLPIVNDSIAATLASNLLMVVGIGGSCVALLALGRHFGIRPVARGLVTRGPYRHVRHPLYVFEAVTQLGLLVVVFSPLAVAVFALFLSLQYRRALLEERILGQTFPEYHEYTARTARFVPGLI